MSVLSMIYQLFIGPLELFFEVVFAVTNRIIGNPGLSIIVLSLAMNFLVLPLYRQADAMQEAERDRAAAMKPWVDHIKRTFKGDERFMMLQTYYRQCNYKQTDALRGSISLLLEIPFFIAAYHFLSHLELLNGVPFGPITNLGAPDAMIAIGDITINFLPLLMTAINVVSAAIYMKGFPLQSKIQMYGIAAIFLILLYASPAGLVFYWTLNNLFSLVKNIFYKLKNPGVVLSVLASGIGILGIAFVLFVHPLSTTLLQVAAILFCMFLQIPFVVHLVRKKYPKRQVEERPVTKEENRTFFLGCIFMALLTGVLIPSAVVSSSTVEFVDVYAHLSPIWYVISAALTAVGTFIIWFGMFYRLATPNGKRLFGLIMWVLAVVAVVNYMFFGTNYGNLSPLLQYDADPYVSMAARLANLGILAVLVALLCLIWRKNALVVRIAMLSMCLAVVGMSGLNIANIMQDLSNSQEAIERSVGDRATIPLSKNGRNVVVLMMDRAAPVYLPSIFHEKPELKEQFAGFTFYPNTISYGSATNAGLPGLFGGYDYIPERMNERIDMTLSEKTDEALKVMPALFDQHGYEVTVCDPSYAGYAWIPDLGIYDDYPNIRTFITQDGRFMAEGFGEASAARDESMRLRNFFCYSIFKTSPLMVQPILYNDGQYNSTSPGTIQVRRGRSMGKGIAKDFLDSYAVLESLPEITRIDGSSQNTFFMMANDTTHQPTVLQEPSYEPAAEVDNNAYDLEHERRPDDHGGGVVLESENQMIHYHVNAAAWLKLGKWFDYLRENGVYDNTRIIIVSDHAWSLGHDEELLFDVGAPDDPHDVSIFNCMLMVKDFESDELRTDERFMTNADTPSLATADLIGNPVNPFTGHPIDMSGKNDSDQHVMYLKEWRTDVNNGNVFLPGYWFSVATDGDVRDGNNWEYLGYY